MNKKNIGTHKTSVWPKFLALYTSLFLAWQCNSSSDCTQSRGPNTTAYRTIEANIWAIEVYDNVDLVLDSLQNTAMQVQAGAHLIDQIQTSYISNATKDTVLSISNTKSCNWVRSFAYSPKLTIAPSPNLRAIYQYGWGQISNVGVLNLPQFTITLYTAAATLMQLNCPNLRIGCNGTGKLEIKGKGDYVFIWARKFPDIRLEGFQAKRCDFYLDSSKDIYLNITDSLIGQIDGSGNVRVRGRPYIRRSANSKGSGQIIFI